MVFKWAALLALAIENSDVVEAPQSGAGTFVASVPAPLVDHHQHLLSRTTADLVEPPPMKAISVPDEVGSLLRLRAERWNDKVALAELYTEDSLVQTMRSPGWIRGPEAAADYLILPFSRAYKMTPTVYELEGKSGYVAGYLTRGEGSSEQHFGKFYLGLRRVAPKTVRIATEMEFFPGPERDLHPLSASQLVAELDKAGVRRAVVLSDSFFLPSRSVPAFAGETSQERHRKVRAENDWVAREVAQFPNRLIAFCSFNPLEDYALQELQYCAGRFKGIKLHLDEAGVDLGNPQHVERVARVFSAANRISLPIVVHVGNNQGSAANNRRSVQTLITRIVSEAPEVPVQIAHLWGGQQYSASALDAYAEMVGARHPAARNLYFDVAEIARMVLLLSDQKVADAARGNIAMRLRQIGLDRIFFGSDDHLSPAEAWASFQKEIPLSREEFNVIAKNAAPYLR